MLVWWGTAVECTSAVSRRERDGGLTVPEATAALARMRAFAQSWHEVLPSEFLRSAAQRFLRAHPLKAADALQLAAAFVASEMEPPSLELVCLDERLTAAAQREGFRTIGL